MSSKGAISTKGIVWTAVALFLVVGGIVVGLNHKTSKPSLNPPASTSQSGTPEGGQVSVPVASNSTLPAGPVSATFYDAGAHGWHAVQSGGATFIQYDGTTGLKYRGTATK